jgi:hypothetical protein
MKFDDGKSPLALIPPEALLEIADVFGFGAKKYGANNWRDDGDSTSKLRTYSSIQRHLNAWLSGEDLDIESGKNHLSHAATQLIILMIHCIEHPELDDRYTK